MKAKVTQKEIKNSYYHILRVGYCNMQYLLNYEQCYWYNSGIYGWNCDIYDINGIIVSTGYRPFGESTDYEIISKYDNQAQSIIYNRELDYNTKKEIVHNLLVKCVNELVDNLPF